PTCRGPRLRTRSSCPVRARAEDTEAAATDESSQTAQERGPARDPPFLRLGGEEVNRFEAHGFTCREQANRHDHSLPARDEEAPIPARRRESREGATAIAHGSRADARKYRIGGGLHRCADRPCAAPQVRENRREPEHGIAGRGQ